MMSRSIRWFTSVGVLLIAVVLSACASQGATQPTATATGAAETPVAAAGGARFSRLHRHLRFRNA